MKRLAREHRAHSGKAQVPSSETMHFMNAQHSLPSSPCDADPVVLVVVVVVIWGIKKVKLVEASAMHIHRQATTKSQASRGSSLAWVSKSCSPLLHGVELKISKP